jgi:hypothetical protein
VSEVPKAGTKLQSDVGAEAIVVKPPSEGGLDFRGGGPVVLGKRYTCETCNAELLITKAGDAELVCHGAAMVVAQPKTLPSSD